MGIAEDVVVRVDGFTFLADFVVVNFEPDPRVPVILGRPFVRTAKSLIDLYEEKLTLRVESDELVFYAEKSEKSKNKQFAHAISVIEFFERISISGSLLNTPLSDKVECSDPEDDNDEIDAFLAMEVSSNFEEGYFDSEGDVIFLENLLSDDTTHNLAPEVIFDHEPKQNESIHNTSITFSSRSDPLHHEFAGELITLPSRIARDHEDYLSRMTLLYDLIPPGVENDDFKDEDNSTFLPKNESSILEPLSPRPSPEPPMFHKFLKAHMCHERRF
ncbi:reverse transcriptase domain-containing protein [Tanacetum coccineum]